MKNHKELFEALLAGETIIDSCNQEFRINENDELRIIDNGALKDINSEYIKDYKIKKPEPKKIYLYETYDCDMSKVLCDKEGYRYDGSEKRRWEAVDRYREFRKKNIINPDKPSMILNAETWERMDE